MSKINTKEKKNNSVNDAKVVKNIKNEPIILSQLFLSSFITRKLEFEKWAKIPHRRPLTSFEFTTLAILK